MVEYEVGKLLASVFNETGYQLIDRTTGKIEKMNKSISCQGSINESDEQSEAVQVNCTDVKMLPGFHPKTFPYFITRTSNFINLIDLKNRISY